MDLGNDKYRSEREEKLLEEIKAKLMEDLGILVWGTIVKTAQGDYRVILVDDDGKLVASS
jgi:hypothetical protein